MARTWAICTRCGRKFDVDSMVGTVSRKRGNRVEYMCQRCASENESYHTGNNVLVGTANVIPTQVGIEFESSYSDDYARNAIFEYGFIPTHDGSLFSDGDGQRYGYWDENSCEYVSPIMQGLNKASKFALTCDYLMNNGHLKVNSSCGTHFHVSINSMKDNNGNNTGRNSYMDMVRRFYNSLFIPLCESMKNDREKCERVFGRYFTGYAKEIDQYTTQAAHHDRYYFINCMANNNIEFRLNKFVSGKQYQNLMKMEVEMVKCIVKNFCEHFMDDDFDRTRYENRTAYRKHKADMTAKKLVRLYEKFSANI